MGKGVGQSFGLSEGIVQLGHRGGKGNPGKAKMGDVRQGWDRCYLDRQTRQSEIGETSRIVWGT